MEEAVYKKLYIRSYANNAARIKRRKGTPLLGDRCLYFFAPTLQFNEDFSKVGTNMC
ncbi:hypothetical protein [Acidaminobacter hydrogenoformans]|uniref:hypothetical protein n=1 Tax=Acidaminobacter hydrogenoformans TaxID=65403 RepID=UPI00147BCF4F|nr:hypothetical protein [Acidaminobacter hydrogenoformans]